MSESSRARLLRFTKNEWVSIRNGAYTKVIRGAVNWASFPFEKFPRAVSIHVDNSTLVPNTTGMNSATISFEIMSKMPKDPENIDDSLLDEFYEDALQIVRKICQEGHSSGNPLIFRRDQQNSAIEARDAGLGVQGLICSVRFDY